MVTDEVLKIVSEASGMPIDKLSRQSRLDEIALDSLDLLDLLHDIEQKYGVEMPDPEKFETLGDIVELLTSRVQ